MRTFYIHCSLYCLFFRLICTPERCLSKSPYIGIFIFLSYCFYSLLRSTQLQVDILPVHIYKVYQLIRIIPYDIMQMVTAHAWNCGKLFCPTIAKGSNDHVLSYGPINKFCLKHLIFNRMS